VRNPSRELLKLQVSLDLGHALWPKGRVAYERCISTQQVVAKFLSVLGRFGDGIEV
jgi:hypothetical protein